MTHTSTERPEALMQLADNYAEACFDQGLNQRTADDKPDAEREKLEKAIRRLHARVQELEAENAHLKDAAWTAIDALEASHAQRVPLTDEEKQNLLKEWSYSQFTGNGDFLDGVDAAERAHGITQEQG